MGEPLTGATGRPIQTGFKTTGLCHATKKCMRRCSVVSHSDGRELHPEYDEMCHKGDCWPR